MGTPDFHRVEEIFQGALERPSQERDAFVTGACGEDAALRADVESLLAAHARAGSFVARPAIDTPAAMAALDAGGRVLRAGARLGPFEITAFLAAGGMGEVYRAHDTRLGRDVAIKTLPRFLAGDPDRLARLEREARVLATLNHPHIAAIHGLEEHDGVRGLVLELVEGHTLADRLQRGPLPVADALAVARQLVEALDAAHEKGIVHRDLKPANISVTPDGAVKVLDFGLATLAPQTPLVSDSTDPATHAHAATRAADSGLEIAGGTAAYMSPEQARSQAIDRRTDIWAFGCVLYEMLSGRPAFSSAAVFDTLRAVVEDEPDWRRLPSTTPPDVVRLLHRCLEKDRRDRLRDIADARIDLIPGDRRPQPPADPASISRVRRAVPLALAAAAGAIVAGVALRLPNAPPADPRPINRFEYDIPESQAFRNTEWPFMAFSAAGRDFVYNTMGGLYVRALGDTSARVVPGTEEDLSTPFFSPDGLWLGYMSRGQLYKIRSHGGTPIPLGPVDDLFGAHWVSDGTIVFGDAEGIKRISENGGTAELIVPVDDGQQVYGPQLLPGREWVLFTITDTRGIRRWDDAQVVVQSLRSGERRLLWSGGSDARYVPTGHIVYAVEDTLFARRFALDGLTVSDDAVPVASGVQRAIRPDINTGFASYGFSGDGTLVYVEGEEIPDRRSLALVDRSGGVSRLDVPPAPYVSPRLSPDGARLAVQMLERDGQSDIWVYDFAEGAQIRQLTTGGNASRPLWTPDGRRVTFEVNGGDAPGIYWQLADGSSGAEPLTAAADGVVHRVRSWSPDGRILAFGITMNAGTGRNTDSGIWTVDPASGHGPVLFYDLPGSDQYEAAFSPDGRWLAYTSSESGRDELYIQPFPATGAKYRVTRESGTFPLWSADGRHLYYRRTFQQVNMSARMQLFALPIAAQREVQVGTERALGIEGFLAFRSYQDYDITPDDARFLLVLPAEGRVRAPRINIVQNWFEELKERAPASSQL